MKVAKLEGKVCGVCGDKALGYNFNAITCESCKAFFRRNALLERDFKCPFNEKCEITTITRRFCQKCRLEKCFSIGMCKALIMSEEDKEMKRKKIIENKHRKRKQFGMKNFKKGFKKVKKSDFVDELSDDIIPEETPLDPIEPELINYENIISEDLLILSSDRLVSSSDDISITSENPLLTLENKNDIANDIHVDSIITSSVEELDDLTKDVIPNAPKDETSDSIDSIICEAIRLEFQSLPVGQPLETKEFNDAERAKLNELIIANRVLANPFDDEITESLLEQVEDSRNESEDCPVLLNVINLTAIVIRRLIKMAKKINAFKTMCQEDQVALLKGGCTEIMILRSALNYDAKKQTWAIPRKNENMDLNVDVLKLAKGNAYEEHEKFIKTFEPKWRADENIILIMCAITLFTPDRAKVVHKDVIKLEQNSYYYLLRRYLECTYSGCEAKSTFLKLMQKISELHALNDELINVYLDVNPSQVEPLLIEIFDLKH